MRIHHPILRALATCLATSWGFSAAAQTLTVTGNLQLWLKADAGIVADASGNVTAWNDQTANANNARQSDVNFSPSLVPNAINSKPALRFDGVDDYLEVLDSTTTSIPGDITTFFVVKFADFATFRAVWAKTASNLPGPNDWYALPNTGIPRAYRGDGTGANLGSVDGGSALRAGDFLVVGWDMAGTRLTHYLAAQPTGSGTIGATLGDADTSLLIGTRGDFFTKMKGDIAEILIYDRALPEADRIAVVDYLAAKYNIKNLPPVVSVKTAPVGPAFAVGDVVTVTATASDPDGTVASVQFFANGGLFATATSPPYSARVIIETAGAYAFTARALDNRGAITNSPAVNVTAGPASAPPLTTTANLKLWLKADAGITAAADGTVTQWADDSGNANHALQADPSLSPLLVPNTLNGKAVLRFDGDNDYLEVADSESVSIAGDITTLFVVKMDDFGTFRAVWAKTANNLPSPNDWYTVPGSGVPRLYRGNGIGSHGSSDGASALTAGAFQIAGYSATGTSIKHHLNGGINGTGTITQVPADTDTPLLIGTRGDLFTKLKGDLAELLIYSVALADADRKQAELYLAGKYGIAIATPTNTLPTVNLTAPQNGLSVVAPASVTVTATAADTDGVVSRVDFLRNGVVIASKSSPPYTTVLEFPAADEATLTAVAVDNLGGTKASAPVAISVTTTVQIPLPAAANLKLWLTAGTGVTATGGSVSAWADQSGNRNNAAQTNANLQPQLVANAVNGKAVIHFDGENDYMSVVSSASIAITGDITSFFVVSFDDFETFRAVWAKTAGNLPAPNDWYTLPSSGIPRVFRGNGPGGSLGSLDGTLSLNAGVYAVVGFETSGTTARHHINGEANGEGQITATGGDTGAPLLIGTRGDLFTKMKGDIAEIVIYDKALSAADRGAALSYLGTKYGITVVGPPPTLSISRSGGNVTVSWPASVTGFVLESATSLPGNPWQAVPGVVNNSITVPIGTGSVYYRLRQP